jgi:hypothetical protein
MGPRCGHPQSVSNRPEQKADKMAASRDKNIEYEQSEWVPLEEVKTITKGRLKAAGVYLARYAFEGGHPDGAPKDSKSGPYDDEDVFYVGYSGTRVGERVNEYLAGNDLNGLAEVLLDLALKDFDWMQRKLVEIKSTDKIRDHAKQLVKDAVCQRIPAELSILVVTQKEQAKALEDELIAHHGPRLLNRGDG